MKNYAELINSNLDEWMQSFAAVSNASRNEVLKGLKPGEAAPAEGKIYGGYVPKWEKITTELRDKILALIEEAKAETAKEMTAAPSEEALRAVQMATFGIDPEMIKDHPERSVRERMSDKIDMLMTRYNDYLSYSALKDFAERCGVYDFRPHPVESRLDALKAVESNIVRNMVAGIYVDRALTEGFVSMLKQDVAAAFGES